MTYSGVGQISLQLSPAALQQALQHAAKTLPVMTLSAAAATSALSQPSSRDPFYPAVCDTLQRYQLPPSTIPARTVVVKAWPITKASQSVVDKMLDYFTRPYVGPREGSVAAQRAAQKAVQGIFARSEELAFPPLAVVRAWMDGLLVHTSSGGSRVATPASMMRVLAAGWIAAPSSDASTTRGTFWVALSMDRAMTRGWYTQQLQLWKRFAMDYAGVESTTEQNRQMPNISGLALADGGDEVSQTQLLQGAYKSALSTGEFAAFVRTTFAMPRVGKTSRDLAQPIEAKSRRVAEALAALNQVPSIVRSVGTVIGQAKSQDDPSVGVRMLAATRAQVQQVREAIKSGALAAPEVIAEGRRIETDTLVSMRRNILASAEAEIQKDVNFEIARDYVRCWTLTQARRQLTRQIDSLLSALMMGVAAANQLVQSVPRIREADKILDDLIERLKKEERELPLPGWQRTTLGVPNWGWGAVGAVAFVGGAFQIRRIRKRSPKKNRRRRRTTRRRRS